MVDLVLQVCIYVSLDVLPVILLALDFASWSGVIGSLCTCLFWSEFLEASFWFSGGGIDM